MKIFDTIKLLIWAAASSLVLSSCLGGNDSESIVTNYYNNVITSFKLADNSNVASSLSSYAFTIDNFGTSDAALHAKYPEDGIIFNPDSLPCGTIPDSVKVTVSYSSPDSAIFRLYELSGELGQLSYAGSDSALYFGSFPDARLTVWARSRTRTYHIKVNVHKVVGDTIKWRIYTDELWGNMLITDQRTDTIGATAYWLVESGNSNKVITSDMTSRPTVWTEPASVSVEGGELLDLQTLYSWHKALYAVGKTSGALLTSTDGFNWTSANNEYQFTSILGNQLATHDVYGQWNQDSISAIVRINDTYHFAVSADAKQWRIDKTIPTKFPVSGFTRPVSVAARPSNGNLTSRLYIVGGKTADGSLTASTWSCDGYSELSQSRNWAEFTHTNVPAMQGGNLIEYALDSDYPKAFWILCPGFNAEGQITQTTHYERTYANLYYSEDSGVSWHPLFDKYPKMADNSAFCDLVGSSAICNPTNYEIYFFGGKTTEGSYSTKIWGGQLPSLTFLKKR